jgi:xylulokinase
MSLLLGIDLGTSFIKASVIDAQTGHCLASDRNADAEAKIIAKNPGWAEQCPNLWWEETKKLIQKLHATKTYHPKDINAIGISYQMHGLVLVDKMQKVLCDSIIWCDSRAIDIGDKAFRKMGEQKCLHHLLNAPGNFTASKLAWVKEHEPAIFKQIHQVLLPGDFLSMKFTGQTTTTPSALSEGMFWDFKKSTLSHDILKHFDFPENIFPEIQPVFSRHGQITREVAKELSLTPGIPITYKAGDQLNNALSLNVTKPGEVAATAGTSGVIFALTDKLLADKQGRVNTFAHVNHTSDHKSLGLLLCINGCGITNSWIRKTAAPFLSYEEMNQAASKIPVGSDGLKLIPFGNGAERMLENKSPGAHLVNLNFNRHGTGHICRAVQEGIAFSFRYGLDILRENGINPRIIRAGKANLFLSEVFLEAFTNSTELELELYKTEGSQGAAIGAGIGAGIYTSPSEALSQIKPLRTLSPSPGLYVKYENHYHKWKRMLKKAVG